MKTLRKRLDALLTTSHFTYSELRKMFITLTLDQFFICFISDFYFIFKVSDTEGGRSG